MQSDNEKNVIVKTEEGLNQSKTIVPEKSVRVTVGPSKGKASNPAKEKIFSDGQKHFSIKVFSPGNIQRPEYSKSNPNIAE